MSRVSTDRSITPEIRALQALPQEGDMIRAGWSQHIRSQHEQGYELAGESSKRKVTRARPFAMMLLARTVFMYSPSPDRDSNGRVIGWVRKFHGPYWFPNWQELADEFGCTIRTLRDEAKLLESLGLVRFQAMRERVSSDGAKSVPEFLIPVPKAILKITTRPTIEAGEDSSAEPVKNLPGAGEVSSSGAGEETSAEPVKNLHRSSSPSTSEREGSTANNLHADGGAAIPSPLWSDVRVSAYTERFKRTPTKTNAEIIRERVSTQHIDLWREVLRVWAENAWNKNNIAGICERYESQVLALEAKRETKPAKTKRPYHWVEINGESVRVYDEVAA